jgi:hypothetical protein
VASAVVSADAPVRKSGRVKTPEVSALAKMNAVVAVRKSSPTRTAVFLVDAVVGRVGCVAGSVPVDAGDLGNAVVIGLPLIWLTGRNKFGGGARGAPRLVGSRST